MRAATSLIARLAIPDPTDIPEFSDKVKISTTVLEKVKFQNVLLNMNRTAIDEDYEELLNQHHNNLLEHREHEKSMALGFLTEKVKRSTLQLQVDEMYQTE